MGTSIYSPRYRKFLERLKNARLESGLTQIQVAARLNVHQSFVSRSESGERRVDVVELVDFAELYKKPIDYFVDFGELTE